MHGQSPLVSPLEPPAMTLPEALDCWIAITGVDPGATRYRMGDWDVRDMHRELKEALELDDSEVTGKLIFEYLVSKYLNEMPAHSLS